MALNPDKLKANERLFRALEHGPFQTLIGIVGGLLGTFLDGRFLAILGLLAPYSLNRSRSLDGCSRVTKFIVYGLTSTLLIFLLFIIGKSVNRSRVHVYTPAEYAAAIRLKQTLPIAQQITNIYKTYLAAPVSAQEPRVELAPFQFDKQEPDGSLDLHTTAVNNSTSPARDLTGTTTWMVGPVGIGTEDVLFKKLRGRSTDKDQPHSDLFSGPIFNHTESLQVSPLPSQVLQDVRSGVSGLYMGYLDTYHDDLGHQYETELCMFFKGDQSGLLFCKGHNRARKLPRH